MRPCLGQECPFALSSLLILRIVATLANICQRSYPLLFNSVCEKEGEGETTFNYKLQLTCILYVRLDIKIYAD